MISDYLLKLASEHYTFNPATLCFLTGGRETSRQFYSFIKHDKPYVLRLIQCGASQTGQIRAEMDWVSYLADQDICVMRPLRADNGAVVLAAEEHGESYALSACAMAEGQPWDKNNPALWNETVFYQWGKAMGDIHRATKDYNPPDGADKRREYTNMVGGGVNAFPSVRKTAETLDNEITALPKDIHSYGLIHYDLGPNNFLIDGERITVIDFDDCTYAWYALDIGSALYLGLWLGRRDDAGHDFTNDIIRYFLKGYLSANDLDNFWLSKIPMFMRLCQIAKFSYTYQSEDPEDEHQKERMRNIENNILFTGCTADYALFKHI